MPRVSRNYQRQDFSQLLTELKTADINAEKTAETVSSSQTSAKQVSASQRKRASLLDDRNMKFIYSKSTGKAHDRDCPLAASIDDDDFAMLSAFPKPVHFCHQCYRKALIREALTPENGKRIDICMHIFSAIKARTYDLQRLILDHHAKVYKVEQDRVYLQVREDRWYLQISEKRCLLYHNNYINLENDQRLIVNTFHLQHERPVSFFAAVEEISQYTWENHVRRKKEKARAELQKKLSVTLNYRKLPSKSLLYVYYHCADGAMETIVKNKNAHYKILILTRYPSTNCIDIVCRIARWRQAEFLDLMDQIKDHCVQERQYDYAEFCQEKIAQKSDNLVPTL